MPKKFTCQKCNHENEIPKKEPKTSKKCTLCNVSFDSSRKEHNTTETHMINNDVMKKVKALLHDNKGNKLINLLEK